jgi:cytochrome P450
MPLTPFDTAMLTNPFAQRAQLLAGGAVVRSSLPPALGGVDTWVVTRMDEAVRVLKDKRFTVDADVFGPLEQHGLTKFDQSRVRTMLTVDGVEHSRLRGLVAGVFTPRYIQTLRPIIQQIADELLDRVQARGHMDVVQDFGYPLPINVISAMLGVPPEYRDQMRVWSEAITTAASVNLAEQQAKSDAFMAYVYRLVAEKRLQPQDDLISQLIAFEAAGERLSEQELLSIVGLLIFAGHETTSNLINIGVLSLLDHPEQLARLQADLSLVPQAVEEFLRFNGPVSFTSARFATEDVELGGQPVRRGDRVLVSLSSASHDPAAFSDPEELDIARSISRQLAFGQGAHICLGAPLARLEGEIAFTTLLRRLPNLRLDAPRDTVVWRGSVMLRGLRSLPVAF